MFSLICRVLKNKHVNIKRQKETHSYREQASDYQRGKRQGRRQDQHLRGLEKHPFTHSKGVYQMRHWDSTGTKTGHRQADRAVRRNSWVGGADRGSKNAVL